MALGTFRDTQRMPNGPRVFKQKGSTTIYAGALVVLNASGYAEPATAATTKVAIGRAEKTSVNSGADGTVSVEVSQGCFKWANKGGDLVTQALVGLDCSIEDDQTVRATAASSSVAGKVYQVDSDGVWVVTNPFPAVPGT